MELGPLFTQLRFGRVKIDLTQSPRGDERWYRGGAFPVGCPYLSDGISLTYAASHSSFDLLVVCIL